MAEQEQDDQLEHTYNSSVRIRNVALKTCQRRRTIGKSGKRGSVISLLVARHDDDDDDILKKRLVQFLHLDWGIRPFQLCSGRVSSPAGWLLGPVVGENIKKCLRLLSVTIFFHIILLWPFYPRSQTNKTKVG